MARKPIRGLFFSHCPVSGRFSPLFSRWGQNPFLGDFFLFWAGGPNRFSPRRAWLQSKTSLTCSKSAMTLLCFLMVPPRRFVFLCWPGLVPLHFCKSPLLSDYTYTFQFPIWCREHYLEEGKDPPPPRQESATGLYWGPPAALTQDHKLPQRCL